ncbi:unnamed protein product [Cuscuta campestris]|uniref:DUF659 domain-containing protein n=1 Tax=Cuscuta campestris TaxID=132261 RepID=A0A484KDC9_9ASTE|nr:unnamed protein product [Cuscuta campestris]
MNRNDLEQPPEDDATANLVSKSRNFRFKGEKIFELLGKFVEKIGLQNVVRVITDNASNMKLAGKLLMRKYPNLLWTPCVAHFDGETKSPMGYIYEAMDRAKESIAKSFGGNQRAHWDLMLPNDKEIPNQQVHIKKRNRLDQARLNDLVFVNKKTVCLESNSNLQLRFKSKIRDLKGLKISSATVIVSAAEYGLSVFQPCMETMADEKIKIEKFDGSDFGFWKMQIEDVLYQKDLYQTLSGENPEKMSDADWAILDKKALGVVRLSLAKSVAFNIVNETTTHGLMKALSNMYEKPSALNKVFLIRQLVNTRMREGASVTIHINQFNSVITRLGSVGIKFDDELQALLLLSSLPDSWCGTVTAVSSASGTTKFTFEGIRDLILGEDIRRRSSGDSSSALLSTEGRGRRNERGSNRGRGKIGATWTLKNVRVIPSLKRMLISVGQLDDSGLDVKFGGGQWKVVKGNLVVARGKKRGSLYMVEIPPEGASPIFVKEKVRFKESHVLKRVTFAKEKLRERVQIQDELARKVQPVREFCDSGSTGRASVPIRQWVRKTSIPALNVSPVNNLLGLENVGSQFVLEARRVIDVSHLELAEKENESLVVTDELKLIFQLPENCQCRIIEVNSIGCKTLLSVRLAMIRHLGLFL